jgi:crossover junction endodeoxyribonuclease RuvC
MRVMGLDPGSRVTGYGVVEVQSSRFHPIAAGTLPLGNGELPDRLLRLHAGLEKLFRELRPEALAIEGVFVHRGLRSALTLAHARGVLLLACAQAQLPIFEYAPATVKRSLTHAGSASKGGVARAVSMILGLRDELPADATDALAVAVCHLARSRASAWQKSA